MKPIKPAPPPDAARLRSNRPYSRRLPAHLIFRIGFVECVRMHRFSFLLTVLVCLFTGCRHNPRATQLPSVVPEKSRASPVPELDKLMVDVHQDLKTLSKSHDWLSAYDNTSLLNGKWIFFMPRLGEEAQGMQQPDQIYIGYEPISGQKGFKYSNVVEAVKDCQFPSLGSRVHAHLVIRGEENAELKDQIRQCIIKRCRALQEEMKKE